MIRVAKRGDITGGFVREAAESGMTLVEALVVVAVLAILVSLLYPAIQPRRPGSARRIKCVSNLKATTLAARLWAGDHGDQFPWELSTKRGGTLELGDSTNIWAQWYAMRLELETPKILTCPSDIERQPPNRSFTNAPSLTSYALNLSSHPTGTNIILASDRNLVHDDTRLKSGVHKVSTLSHLSWDSTIHRVVGNVSVADGTVLQTTSPLLQQVFQNSAVLTNTLVIP